MKTCSFTIHLFVARHTTRRNAGCQQYWITVTNALHRRGQAVDLTTEHRVTGSGPTVEAEVHRVEEVGGWIEDGRVCDVIAVSRAFGDREFKGNGSKSMLQRGVR